MSEKIIAEALGLRPLEEVREENKNSLPSFFYENGEILDPETNDDEKTPSETVEDIDFAKNNIKNIIQTGNASVTELFTIAKQSEQARTFEVLAGMMKTMLDANKDFVELAIKKKYEKEELPEKATTNVTNNNLVISTADLLRLMKGEKNDQ